MLEHAESEQRRKRIEILNRELNALMMDFSAPGVTEIERIRITEAMAYNQQRVAELIQLSENRQQNLGHRQMDWKSNLYLLDCRKARTEVEKIRNKLGNNSGAASFFIQDSEYMQGDHCVSHIKDVFRYEKRQRRHLKAEFGHQFPLTSEMLLKRFKLDLGINAGGEDWQADARRIADKLCEDLNLGDLIFIEIVIGKIALHEQNCLQWILDKFWPLLLDKAAGVGAGVHCLLVLIAHGRLFKPALPVEFACVRHAHEKTPLREIKPEFWEVDEIEGWLTMHAKLPKGTDVRSIAEGVWEKRKLPSLITQSLLKELDLIFTTPR
ncbi:MAG: hypothetical protein ABI977_19610 [Acidobacteriota bacterium]